MDKKRSHNLEQKVERKGKSTEGKCAQITMIPLCSMYRCSPEPPPVIPSWGGQVAGQGRTVIVVPNCYYRRGVLVPPGGRIWVCWAQVSE